MKRRAFLKALAAGTVGALLGTAPRQLGDPDACSTCGTAKTRIHSTAHILGPSFCNHGALICTDCFYIALHEHTKRLTKIFIQDTGSKFAKLVRGV